MTTLARLGARLELFAMRIIGRLAGRTDIVDLVDDKGMRRVGRVHAWGRHARRLRNGDAVGELLGVVTYSVQTDMGWWANVARGCLSSWSRHPVYSPRVSTTGRRIVPPVRSRKVADAH